MCHCSRNILKKHATRKPIENGIGYEKSTDVTYDVMAATKILFITLHLMLKASRGPIHAHTYTNADRQTHTDRKTTHLGAGVAVYGAEMQCSSVYWLCQGLKSREQTRVEKKEKRQK